MLDSPDVASWRFAARAMAMLACGAIAVGLLSIRARERPGGFWLMGWAMLLVAGVAYAYQESEVGHGHSGSLAFFADAMFAPMMWLGAWSLRSPRPGWIGAIGVGLAAGTARTIFAASGWANAELLLAVTVAPACLLAAAWLTWDGASATRLRAVIAVGFGALAAFEVWDAWVDWTGPGNNIAFQTLIAMSVPIAAVQIAWRVTALREGMDDARQASLVAERRRDLERTHFHRIFDEMRELVAELGPGTEILYVNRRARDLLGIDPDAVLGRRGIDFVEPENRYAAEELWRKQLKEGALFAPVVFPVPDTSGHIVHLEVSVSHLRLDEEPRILVLARDVTDRQENEARAEARLRELELQVASSVDELHASRSRLQDQERLAAVGTLASGIAHQINNPLGSIVAASDFALLEQSGPDVERVHRDALERIGEEARRAGRIVKSILRFARHGSTSKWVDDLVPVVHRAIELTRPYVAERRGRLTLELSTLPLPVLMSPIEIEQLVVNLVRNAAESRGSRANVRVRLDSDAAEKSAWLEVTDDGRGIASDDVERVFDPFFTTRLTDGGSGLGLSVAHAIVEDHRGEVIVDSEQGRGTCIRVRLPLHRATAGAGD